jgi:hypothetical protein
MVARLVCFVLLLSGLEAAAEPDPQLVRDSYEEGDNVYKPRPYRRSAVATVVITENATKSLAGASATDDCSGFVVTPRLIKQYFGRAKTVGSRDYSHTLDWSPCVANGSLVLADGRKANWGVQQLGLGWLHINHRLYYFHCEKKCGVYLLGADLAPKLPPK